MAATGAGASDTTSLLLILVCLLLSAFFSSSETAFTSLGALKIKHLLNKSKRYSTLKYWLNEPGKVLTTILVFNNAVNIFASALTTELATRWFESRAVGIATGITTFLVLIFGEIVPKSIAKVHAERIAVMAMRIVKIFCFGTWPLIWLLSKFADGVLHLLDRGEEAAKPPITEDELEFLVSVGEEHGVIENTKKQMISGVFDFDDKAIREIMTPRPDVVAIDVNESFADAVSRTVTTGVSRLPVYEDRIDNVIGIVLAKDLLKASASPREMPVSIRMIMRKPCFVPESNKVIHVFKQFKRTRSQLAVVIDEHGGMAGVVTMEDILEEIVGDIQDEYDTEEEKIKHSSDGSYEVAGAISIDEFSEFFKLPDETIEEQLQVEADTLAGLLTQVIREMPQVGQTVQIGSVTIKITSVDNNRIQRVRVRREQQKEQVATAE